MEPTDHRAPSHVAAGFVSRLAAFVIDLVVLGLCASAATWAVEAADAVLVPSVAVRWERSVLAALMAFAAAFGSIVYFVGLWSAGGRTAGHLLLGLRVVPVDGGPMTIRRSLLRFAGYVVAAVPLYVGFLWVLVDPGRRGWHDHLAGTTVVYDPPLEERARRARERSRGPRPVPSRGPTLA